jgi:pimeloyl-ACP methyl ester carboxylesterase
MNERALRLDGLRVRCLEQGKGAAVLLLHGASLGSSADVWGRNLAPLAAHGLRVIAPDLPGFGHTDNPVDHSLGYRQRFVTMLIDALELERVALVGRRGHGRRADARADACAAGVEPLQQGARHR